MHLIPTGSRVRAAAQVAVAIEALDGAHQAAQDMAASRAVRVFRDEHGIDPHPSWVQREPVGSDIPETLTIRVLIDPPTSASEAIVAGKRVALPMPVSTSARVPIVASPFMDDSADLDAPVSPVQNSAVHIGWDADTGLMVFDTP